MTSASHHFWKRSSEVRWNWSSASTESRSRTSPPCTYTRERVLDSSESCKGSQNQFLNTCSESWCVLTYHLECPTWRETVSLLLTSPVYHFGGLCSPHIVLSVVPSISVSKWYLQRWSIIWQGWRDEISSTNTYGHKTILIAFTHAGTCNIPT